jgi:CBS domain-containing protein
LHFPDTSIIDAARLMLELKFSGLPVVDAGGRLVGIVTEGDLLRRTETGTQPKRARWIEFLMGSGRLATEYAQTRGRKVSDVMTPEVRRVTEDALLEEVVHLMGRHQINRVLVVRDGKLVGIVTRANLLHALASVAAETEPGPTSARLSKIASCGLTQCLGWSCRHSNKPPRRRGKPPDDRVNGGQCDPPDAMWRDHFICADGSL